MHGHAHPINPFPSKGTEPRRSGTSRRRRARPRNHVALMQIISSMPPFNYGALTGLRPLMLALLRQRGWKRRTGSKHSLQKQRASPHVRRAPMVAAIQKRPLRNSAGPGDDPQFQAHAQKRSGADLSTVRGLMTTQETAALLRVCCRTITRYAMAGTLTSYSLGTTNRRRFKREDVERLLRRELSQDHRACDISAFIAKHMRRKPSP